ncbi:MAG TPA: hypothetical protein DCL54_13940 [Alphaproteobacteria bacterium]|nr:hypothetical protein [Alphaproteobacteria bacterium]
MSASQAFIGFAARLYSSRTVQGWRAAASKVLNPLWPQTDERTLRRQVLVDRTDAGNAQWHWRRLDGACELNGGSGELFIKGQRVRRAALPAGTDDLPNPVDLTAYMRGKVVPRGPVTVLYNGRRSDLGAFASVLLPRFFALDALGVPEDVLSMVTFNMARRPFFQDALADGVFRPRAVDLFRPMSVVRTNQVHEYSVPPLNPGLLTAAQSKLAAIYGPFANEGPPVLLAEDAHRDAPLLLKTLAERGHATQAGAFLVLDPETTNLFTLIRHLAVAPVVAGPANGVLEAIALAPRAGRVVFEIGAMNGATHTQTLARSQGERYQQLSN